jgi:hypothetical protein
MAEPIKRTFKKETPMPLRIGGVLCNRVLCSPGCQMSKKTRCTCSADALTEHVCVSYSSISPNLSAIGQAVGKVQDFIPFYPILLGSAFQCVHCGEIKLEGGLLGGPKTLKRWQKLKEGTWGTGN